MGGKVKERLAVIGPATWEPFLPLLTAALQGYGIEGDAVAFGIGRDTQVLAGQDPDFEAKPPRGALFFFDARLLFHEFLANPRTTHPAVGFAEQAAELIVRSLKKLSKRHQGMSCVLALLEPPLPDSGDGVSDPLEDPFTRAVDVFRDRIRKASREHPGWSFLDLSRLSRLHGSKDLYDARLDLLARFPASKKGMQWIAERVAAHWTAVMGKSRKVLALDCDNTLWGGIIGEDGIDGIQMSDEGPGRAYLLFQRAVLRLESRGVLLVLCSRNSPEQVEEVFASHPNMAIPRDRIAATHIGWGRKSEGLLQISKRLGLGLDSFVFIDDNPAEREEIRHTLPAVAVPEFPSDPASLATFGYDLGWRYFYRLAVGEEDRSKTAQYRLKADLEAYTEKFKDAEGFLESLGMKLTLSVNDPALIARAAQLCQKTNQFNLSLKRHTASEILAFMEAKGSFVILGSLTDRFGNHGWTALAIIEHHESPSSWAIHSLLVSCRVLGRGVEQAFLKACLGFLREIERIPITACFIPGPKNGLARDFYSSAGFLDLGESQDGRRDFEWSGGPLHLPLAAPISIGWKEDPCPIASRAS